MAVRAGSWLLPVLLLLTTAPSAQAPTPAPGDQPRTIAITIDDAPFVNARGREYLPHATACTAALLKALRAHGVTATVFVNERQLDAGGPTDVAARTALLERWVAAGHELGNHTYAHVDANAVTADAYVEDIDRGDRVTDRLMAPRGTRTRYFRHPFTHTGDTAVKKAAIDAALAHRKYVITPHTVENADWLFNRPYVQADEAGDAALRDRLRDAYLAHTRAVVGFAEQASLRVFGRAIPQVLLIHTNDITAAHLPAVLADLAARGYRFVSLDEVMRDAAYRTPDTWVGRGGPTWLLRWSRSLGQSVSFADEPEPPAWVAALASDATPAAPPARRP